MMRLVPLTLAAALVALPALAQDMSPAEQAHAWRQAHMSLNAANIGPLAGMAKGEVEYDAGTATLHAGNLAAYSNVNLLPYFVEGSSSEDLEDSRALPNIWDNLEDVAAKQAALHEAAMAAVDAGGQGQEALAAAVQKIGQACTSCHEEYREPEE